MLTDFDVVIVGGGIVGMTLACALAQSSSLSIAILEKEWFSPQTSSYNPRVSALSFTSQRLLQALQVWERIPAKHLGPFRRMEVWDASHRVLCFDSCEIDEPALGCIVENHAVQSALIGQLKQHTQVTMMAPVTLQALHVTSHEVVLTLADGQHIRAQLAVGADGAHSWLREQAGIPLNRQDYAQKALITTIQTTLPHEQCAHQLFYPQGILALLPLWEESTYSIVWSLPTEEAERVLELSDEAFSTCLAGLFLPHWGHVRAVKERYAFPLYRQQAQHYVQPRIALVGDAAHTLHPLAGQGVNLGLLDAASLAEIVTKQQDCSRFTDLRYYERWRKADNLALLAGVDGLKKMFTSEVSIIQTIRSLGCAMMNRIPFLKHPLTRYAMGQRAHLPRLVQGKKTIDHDIH